MPDSTDDTRNAPRRSHPQVSNRRRSRGTSRSPDAISNTPADPVEKRLEWFAKWSDDVFTIPGTGFRVGLEPLIGLIPGVGDAAGLIVSAYVPIEAWRQGAPKRLIGKMVGIIAVDALVGVVPVLGDVFDFAYKANRRNVEMLEDWLEE
ncbi:hypothetical protein CRI94_03620 [Longibacter salinarum]|uniref:DUF4112 domain-containing protein n=1 Tax=Longibacter salinarum TaxID=1850348 RepID=A0A2A8CZL8_9BACT|nr:DUF4112 domain-containing protein [Longibacter salinarum]PEN14142.1 hypothetical protein CRI94_03620 [Longibacter salinarum]